MGSVNVDDVWAKLKSQTAPKPAPAPKPASDFDKLWLQLNGVGAKPAGSGKASKPVLETDIIYKSAKKPQPEGAPSSGAAGADANAGGASQAPLAQEDVEQILQRALAALKDTSAATRRKGLQDIKVRWRARWKGRYRGRAAGAGRSRRAAGVAGQATRTCTKCKMSLQALEQPETMRKIQVMF